MKKTYFITAALIVAGIIALGAGAQDLQAASNKPSPQAIAIAKDKDGGNPTPAHIRPELLQAYADALGLTTDQLKAQMSGDTIYHIAMSKGMKKKAFRQKVGDMLQQQIDSGKLKGGVAKYYSDYIKWSKSTGNKD